MDLTLLRRPAPRRRRLVTAATPVGVLVASALLAGGFVLAVSDLVSRLG